MPRTKSTAVVAVVTGTILSVGALGHDGALPTGAAVHRPADIAWKDGPDSVPPGAKVAVLDGDPTRPGPFVMRLKFPDGFRVAPHTHPKQERVTVISGTLHVGMGATVDPAGVLVMPAGSFGTWPAGMAHFGWCTGETVVQLHGDGPWGITYLNPADDPRNRKK
jgi:quercetin dioxygenase-like cupin family protein